jgi:aldose sugar dehydrogenase
MPQKTPLALFALAALLGGTTPLAAQVQRSTLHDFEVVTVAEGLVNPWSMAWLPNGDMLITERPGRLSIVLDGVLLP